MKLFIMRHGEAQQDNANDELRELTSYGISEIIDVANMIKQEVFDLIIISPYLRAKQTAELLITANQLKAKTDICELITPEGSASQVHDYLDGILAVGRYQNVLMVSHMPLLSYLMAELTVGNNMPIFQTGAIAKIDYQTDMMNGSFVEMICPFNSCDT